MAAQSIRPSQYITTFGPGSILEGPDGPRVVYDLARGNPFHGRPVAEFTIHDAGLGHILGDDAQIVRIPTNADLGAPDQDPIYDTEPFPKWSLCVAHQAEIRADILYRWQPGTNRTGCPRCQPLPTPTAARVRARREAIRFVQVCPEGHMDDVNWSRLIRHRTADCRPGHLLWRGSGGSLGAVSIECPLCGQSANLGLEYGRAHRCTGIFPERGELANRGAMPRCNEDARIMQRGAAQLYQAEHVTAITIPSLDSDLHQVLASTQMIRALRTMNRFMRNGFTADDVRTALSPDEAPDPRILQLFSRFSDAMIVRATLEVLQHEFADDEPGLRRSEFRQLQRAATHGHPSQESSTPGAPPLFEVIRNDVRADLTWQGQSRLRVTPVSRLRAVMVQTGYRRMPPTTRPVGTVSVRYQTGVDSWYPGVELYGEGLFLDLAPDEGSESVTEHFNLDSEESQAWLDSYGTTLEDTRHPVAVWWHTLAHRLILALSVDSGYSSASIRERVYVRVDPDTGRAVGGVLLYTVQPGGDGTLGGLIALVPRFERVLRSALERIDSCSNDPLCGEEAFDADRPNGSICYACGLVSETSCEIRNMFLDRTLLRKHPL